LHLCIAASLAALAALSCATVCDETAARASAVDNATNHLFAPLMVCLLARYMLASRAGPTACTRKHCANSFTSLRRFKLHKGEGRAVRECGSAATSPPWPMLWAHRRAWSATNAPSFLRHGVLDRFDQLTGLKGLAQKGNATGLERLLAHGLVIEGGHEDDRKRGSGTLEPPPQFNARHPAEMDVQEETIDLSYCSTIEEFLRRCKDHGRKALCVQQALGGIEHAGIVIHDCHDCPTLQHEMSRLPSDRKTKSAQIFDRTRIYDRIDARRDLSLGETFRPSPRRTAQGLCEMQSTQTQ